MGYGFEDGFVAADGKFICSTFTDFCRIEMTIAAKPLNDAQTGGFSLFHSNEM